MPRNIVVIIGDDIGVDQVPPYYAQPSPGDMPNLAGYASNGMRFNRHNAGGPQCSPGRSALLTGILPNRSGIGFVTDMGVGLDSASPCVARNLAAAGYRTSAIGKWHVSGSVAPHTHALAMGFQRFEGPLGNVSTYTDYPTWYDSSVGGSYTAPGYLTEYTATKAIAQISAGAEPYFLWVAFNAPHSPYHCPPGSYGVSCGDSSATAKYRAMKTVLDVELGRFIQEIDLDDTVVFFFGDNGTPQGITSPYPTDHLKGTVYLGGIRTPCIVFGAGIGVGVSNALISGVDFPATAHAIAGIDPDPDMLDSASYAPLLADSRESGARSFSYSELFAPNGLPFVPETLTFHLRSAEDHRHHLVVGSTDDPESPVELYDVIADPFEMSPLDLDSLTRAQRASYLDLQWVIETRGQIKRHPARKRIRLRVRREA